MEEDTGPRGYFSRAEAGQPVESPVVFRAVLFATSEAKGAWVFVEVPTEVAPPVTGSWGMSPVLASVEGRSWHPTVWREKSGRTLLPVPKKIRQKLAIGDEVGVSVQLD